MKKISLPKQDLSTKQVLLTKQDLSILIGNGLDHFNIALYSFIAPVLSKIFFPHNDPIVGLILTYSVLASSSVTRPFGSIIFSIIAKRWGPALSLSYSLVGVAISSILIGIIPTYETIGWASPLMLIIFRILQGIFAEGENAIAKLYILEDKFHIQALQVSTLYELSTILGIILASLASTILIIFSTPEYWRLCFILGGSTAIAGYYLRKNLKNIRIPTEQKITIRISLFNTISLINNNKMKVLYVAIINGFSYMTYTIPFIVMNSFIPLISSVSLESMMTYNTLLLILDAALFIVLFSFIRKRLIMTVNYNMIMFITATILLVTIIPLWEFMNNASLWYISLVRIWIIILGVIFTCPINVWVNNLLPKEDKYFLSSISTAIGNSLLGHFTPTICIALWHFTKDSISIAIYIAMTSAITIWALRMSVKEKT